MMNMRIVISYPILLRWITAHHLRSHGAAMPITLDTGGATAFLLLLCAFDCTAVREHILEYVLQKCVKMLRRTLQKSENVETW